MKKLSKEQFSFVEQETLEMLEKEATPKSSTYTRAIFEQPLPCRKKVDGGNHPLINLKNLNKFIPYEHFKMKGLHCLEFLLEQDNCYAR